MKCPNCQQENPSGARFCNGCGAPLAVSAPPDVSAGPSSFGEGRYRVERTLGEGGKGIVFLCQDTVLGRRVAIKLVKEEVMDPDSLARFQREVQAMAQLVHPNVVTIFDIGQENGRYYLVLELMEGGSVEDLFTSAPSSRLDVSTSLRIGQEVARGLAHAHAHGILHRDVKPGNIWLTKEGAAKLGDFGLAYLGSSTRITRAGMMVGTVAYMAPEVALGRQADERSDLYMLGVSLYEMVTGRVPFPGDDPVRVIFSHVNDLPLSPRRVVPNLPSDLETLIMRLLAKDPEQRPDGAAEVLLALEQIGVGAVDPNESGFLPRTTSESEIAQPPTPEPRWAQALVGRNRERDILRARLDAAMQGQGGLVFITGEAGIGKTRLAAELRSYARGRGCQWLEGRFEKEGSIPLQPYVEAVRAYLRTAPPDSLPAVVGPYATELARAFPDIAANLNITPPTPEIAEEDPAASQQRHLEAMCHFFLTIASQAPLVLFLDDLQWAPSMDTLQALAQQAASQPFLLVGAYRDAELREKPILSRSVLSMNRDRLFLPLTLHRLSLDEVGQMVAQALGQASTEQLVNLVYERTEGNPFFAEELVRYLVESGALTLEGQVWDIRETPSLQLPDSVKLVVEERLERLEQDTRQVLAVASVIGKEFALSLLQEVTAGDEEALVDVVDQAVEARVLVPRSGVGQEVYAFADNQVQEVLYQGTGTARRRRYHLRVGEAIEKVHGRRLEEHYDALAHHFLEGNNLEKAADYAIKAGDLAHGHSVFPRARSHYLVAAELLEELGEESERAAHVHSQLGLNLMTAYVSGVESEAAQKDADHIHHAIDLFLAQGTVRRAAMLYRYLGAAYISGTGVAQSYSEALRHYQAAVDLVAGTEDSLEKAIAYDGLAFGYYVGMELDRAEELAREAVRIAEAIGDEGAMTPACTELGLILVQKGKLEEGLAYVERSWAAAQRARIPVYRLRSTAYPIAAGPWLGDSGLYRIWLNRYEELQAQTGIRRYQRGVLSAMSAILVRQGDPERGRDFLDRLEQTPSGPGSGPIAGNAQLGAALAMLGEWDMAQPAFASAHWTDEASSRLNAIRSAPDYARLLLDQGDHQGAQELLWPQRDFCRERGAVTYELNLLPPLVESYIQLGRLEEAHTCLERAQEILARPEDWRGLAAGALLAEALLAATEERWEEAESAFQRATETNERHGLVYDQARALFQWAVMFLDRAAADPSTGTGQAVAVGDRERGIELLDRSMALFQRCDAKKDIERIIARKEVLTA